METNDLPRQFLLHLLKLVVPMEKKRKEEVERETCELCNFHEHEGEEAGVK